MIDLAHEEVLFFLALLTFGNVLDGADEAHRLSLGHRALKMSKPLGLHPTNLTVSPTEPELGRGALRSDWIECCAVGCPNPIRIVRMDPIHELLDSGPILSDGENFFAPRIPGKDAVDRIVLP